MRRADDEIWHISPLRSAGNSRRRFDIATETGVFQKVLWLNAREITGDFVW